MRKIIEGAVDYADELGFSPHPDCRSAKVIFGDIDAGACPVKYDFGQEGMPMYIRGPNESINQAKKIVDQLASWPRDAARGIITICCRLMTTSLNRCRIGQVNQTLDIKVLTSV